MLLSKYTNKSYDFETNYVKISYEAALIIENLDVDMRQKVLETKTQSERMKLIISLLQNFANQNNNIDNKYSNQITNSSRNPQNSLNILEEKISNSKKMTDEAKSVAKNNIQRLKSLNNSSPEYDSLYTYVETLVNLPWDISSTHVIDIKKAQVGFI